MNPDLPDPSSSSSVALAEQRSSTDNTLVAKFRTGDDGAADRLFTRYAERLKALADRYCKNGLQNKIEPDDIVQSVFRVFFHGVKNQAYDVPVNGELWGLLMVMALNKIRNQVDYHKASKRDITRTTPLCIPANVSRYSVEEAGSETLLKMILEEQIAQLPEQHQLMIRMRLDAYEVQEISDRCGCSRRTVERVLQEFRTRLSQQD